MRFSSFIRRFVSLSIVAFLIGGPSIALADTELDFTVNAQPYGSGVCSVTASAGGSVNLTRYSSILWNDLNASGPMTLTFDTTGLAGDRNCYSTASNTAFMNADGTVMLVNANALSILKAGSVVYIGQTTPRSFLDVADIPDGGTAVNLTWYLVASIPNPDALAGAYTSTMTITLSSTDI